MTSQEYDKKRLLLINKHSLELWALKNEYFKDCTHDDKEEYCKPYFGKMIFYQGCCRCGKEFNHFTGTALEYYTFRKTG